jgi:hypothetical protein
MIKNSRTLCSLGLLVGLGISGAAVNAQQDSQAPNPPSQPPAQQQTAPDSQSQSPSTQAQTFAGTIMKSGDKYVLQDAAGTSYDIDRQDLVKPHEGKKVRINGVLDADGKTIHIK